MESLVNRMKRNVNKEEKWLRHVARLVANFLGDNKPKIHQKENLRRFKLHRSYLISFSLSKVAKCSWLNPKGPFLSYKKENENFLVGSPTP